MILSDHYIQNTCKRRKKIVILSIAKVSTEKYIKNKKSFSPIAI